MNDRPLLFPIVERLHDGWSLRALVCTSATLRRAILNLCPNYWRGRLRTVAPHWPPMATERACFWQWVRWTSTLRTTLGVGYLMCVFIDRAGRVHTCTDDQSDDACRASARCAIPARRSVTQVSCQDAHCLALLDDGTCAGWGHNTFDVLSGWRKALPAGRRFVQACAGENESVGVLDDGACVVWSREADGLREELRRAANEDRRVVHLCIAESYVVYALCADGTMLCWACGFPEGWIRSTIRPPQHRHFVQVSAMGNCLIALMDNGHARMWNHYLALSDDHIDVVPPHGRRLMDVCIDDDAVAMGILDDGTCRVLGPCLTDVHHTTYGAFFRGFPANQTFRSVRFREKFIGAVLDTGAVHVCLLSDYESHTSWLVDGAGELRTTDQAPIARSCHEGA